MTKLPLFLATMALATACSGPATSDAGSTASRTENIVAITEGQPMATADLGISGMSCEMMCGGMIKSALVKVPGVEKTDVVFHDGDSLGYAKVTYDPVKVDDAQLVKTVQSLADGQYQVRSIAVVKQVKDGKQAQCGPANAAGTGVCAGLMPEVGMPSLVQVLLTLVRA